MLMNAFSANQTCLVFTSVGQAFNKMVFLPPFDSCPTIICYLWNLLVTSYVPSAILSNVIAINGGYNGTTMYVLAWKKDGEACDYRDPSQRCEQVEGLYCISKPRDAGGFWYPYTCQQGDIHKPNSVKIVWGRAANNQVVEIISFNISSGKEEAR